MRHYTSFFNSHAFHQLRVVDNRLLRWFEPTNRWMFQSPEVFGEHHLPHAPVAVHDFVGLHRAALLDAHEAEVVEDAFRRKRDVEIESFPSIAKMN